MYKDIYRDMKILHEMVKPFWAEILKKEMEEESGMLLSGWGILDYGES